MNKLNLRTKLSQKNENERFIYLQKFVQKLLIENPEKLNWLLYRIDVSEQEVMPYLNNNNVTQNSIAISELILQRLQKTLKSRNENSDPGSPNWSFDV